jgi:uncharacterized membrane protein YhfC
MDVKRILRTAIILILAILVIWIATQRPETILPALNALLMIALGLGIGVLFAKKWGVNWGLFGVGALTFIFSQVLHIPFNTFLLNPFLAEKFPNAGPGSPDLLWWGLFLGLSAGLFEETARYLVLRFWRKDVTTWEKSMMFGAGHGGSEAVIIGIITFIAFFQLMAYRQIDLNALAEKYNADQITNLRITLDTYWNYKWYEHLWGAVERFSVLPVHLAATVMVYRGVRDKKIVWYLAAVAWHTAVDCFAVFSGQSWGIPLTELILFVFGMFGWGIVFLLRRQEPAPEMQAPEFEPQTPPASPIVESPAIEKPITKESLEESRYE